MFILARESIAPTSCRLLTFRAIITFLLELVYDPTAPPTGLPLVHPLHLSVVSCAVSRCSHALRCFLADSKFLERPNHRFIEIFETEHRIVLNSHANDVSLETIAGRCELLLSVAQGPAAGGAAGGGRSTALEDRHPFGDVENVRQLVRVSLLLRQLEMQLGGIRNPQRLIDETGCAGSSRNSEDMEEENAMVDLSKRKHVQCRLRTSSSSSSSSSNKKTEKTETTEERPIFLIITPLVMSIAEVVTAAKNTQNQVQNSSIVPIHLIDASVDRTDNQTLHLTVFSHTQPKLFQRLGRSSNIGGKSSSSLSCWRMTVGFANPGTFLLTLLVRKCALLCYTF